MLNCPYCYPNSEGTLNILTESHADYCAYSHAADGTKKWFICGECGGIFCYDRVMARWQMSPKTYTEFVKKGFIKDLLNA